MRVPVAANLRVHGNIPYYGANGIQDYVNGFTHDGEFVLVAEDGANDLKNYPVQHVKGRIWVNNHAHVLQGKPNLMDNLFLAYSLHRADIASYLVGGSRAKLNADTLMTLEVLLPGVEEQTKIGRLLDGIDNLITLHQRKQNGLNLWFLSKKCVSNLANEWEQRKLGDSLNEYNEQCEKDGTYEHVSLTKEGVVPKTARYDRDSLVQHEDKKYRVTHVDDICYNPANLKFGVICRNRYKTGIFSPIYVTFRVSDDFSAKYIEPYVCRNSFITKALLNQEGTVYERMSVKPADLIRMDLIAPRKEEQILIGDLFERIDNLITLHQCKEKSRIAHAEKKAMFHATLKLANDWEQCKLGDIVSVCSGKDYKHLGEGDIPVYGTGGYMLSVSDALSYSDDAIGIGRKGTIDKPYILKAPFWTVDTLFYAVPKEKKALDFVYCLFQIIDWKSKDESTGVPSLSKIAINSVDVSIPKSEEQVQIGTVFLKIDNLITLHQREQESFTCHEGEIVKLQKIQKLTDDWEQRKLGDVVEITMGQSPDGSTYCDTPAEYILVQGNADLKDGWVFPRVWTTQKTKTADAGDLIMSVRAPAGAMGKTAYNVVLGRGVAAIKGNEFIFQTLVKMDSDGYWKKLAAGSTFESINSDTVSNAVISIPQQEDEQKKIGDLFESIDNLITLHQCKQKEFELRKSSSILSTGKRINPLTWEQRKLGEISEKAIEKNRAREYSETFTNSAELGIVSQMEYFDHAISKTESIGGYYVVRPDDFVYNPRISVSAPVGPINRNKLKKIGVMSPLYTVFRVHDIRPQYLEYYFKSFAWHSFMRFNGDSGARSDRFSIKTALFFDMPIPCPSLDEQEKIGMLLDKVDNLITLHQRGENIYKRRQT